MIEVNRRGRVHAILAMMHVLSRAISVALALCVSLLAGCAAGPDFQPPAPPAADRYTAEPTFVTIDGGGSGGQSIVAGMDLPAQWWTLFNSDALDLLVRRSLAGNATVQSAQAALRAAEESYLAQRGVLAPSVAAGVSVTRQKLPPVLSSPLASGASIFSLHTAQVSVSYAPDVFGGARRRVEQAAALAEAQRFELEATYLSLTANVVLTAIEEASIRARIAALEDIAALERRQVELMQRQFELGEIPRATVTAQRVVLAQSEAALAPLRKQLALKRNLLTSLAGLTPQDEIAETFDFSRLQLPATLPLTLPSALVRQRPDVRAMEAQLHAASAEIGITTAAMLPQFDITAQMGGVATSFLAGGGAMWGIGASVVQPIFQGGALEHRKRAAEATYDEKLALYRATVLSAFQNVADSLRALQYDAEALNAAVQARVLAEEGLNTARRQVEMGEISYLALVSAQQAFHQASLAEVQAKANRYADTAALFQALGGGWWNKARATE